MNRKLPITAALATAGAALAVAAPASATTFCVPTFHAECPNNGTNVAQANLETAMSMNGNDGTPDTVIIGPGTFTDTDSFTPGGNDALIVRGAGKAQTQLTSSSSGNIFVVNLNAGGNPRAITMRDLTIVVPASLPDNQGAALQNSGDTLENVDIEIRNPGASAIPSWVGGGTFRDGRIYATGAGSVFDGVKAEATATNVTVEGASIEGAINAVRNTGVTGTMTIRDSRIVNQGQGGVVATSGTTVVQNTTFDQGDNVSALYALANSSADVELTADHVTILGQGNGNSAPLNAQATNGQTGSAALEVRNSVIRGFPFGFLRQAPTSAAFGNAHLTIAYTNQDPGVPVSSSGDGSVDIATGNTTADPQLAADLSLPAGSPAIDAADPASTVTTDILGAARPVDGDAVPGARADQGAFEYQPPAPPDDPGPGVDPADTTAPDTVAGKGPKKKSKKRKATFTFTSEAGATFTCSLDGKPATACVSPAKVKGLKPGKHTFAVAATDAAGNTDATPAKYRFKVIRKKK